MAFPKPHIHLPQLSHTHTIILLHGRGSNGPEFAEDFFSSFVSSTNNKFQNNDQPQNNTQNLNKDQTLKTNQNLKNNEPLENNQNLATLLPHWRWVFPTSKTTWSTTFQEDMSAWFDVYSLTHVHDRQELQVDGLRESVGYILDILEHEVGLLNGNAGNVYLGGISMGMATALCAVFCARGMGRMGRGDGQGYERKRTKRLGGVLGFCGWLPFANEMEELVVRAEKRGREGEMVGKRQKESEGGAISRDGSCGGARWEVMQSICAIFEKKLVGREERQQEEGAREDDIAMLVSIPVFLSHGTDDQWVSVDQGRQAFRILDKTMINVEWHEFAGAECDGHWIKEPEGFDQILEFLEHASKQVSDDPKQ